MDFVLWLKSLFESNPITCDAESNVTELVLSILLTVGVFISYLPQLLKIAMSRTSDGISPSFLLLGGISMNALLANTVVLQYPLFICCQQQSSGRCLANLMGILQIGVQWCCFMALIVLFITFFPADRKYMQLIGTSNTAASHEWKKALFVGAATTACFVIVVISSMMLVGYLGDAQQSMYTSCFANFLGLLSMVLSTIQFLPQLIQTWKEQRVGALSIPTMMIQTPGSFLFVYTLALRPGNNITTWITYLITGILQGILLVMCVVFQLRENSLAREELRQDEITSPLLHYEPSDFSKASIREEDVVFSDDDDIDTK